MGKSKKIFFFKCRLDEALIYFWTTWTFWNSKNGRECETVEMEVIVADRKLGVTLIKKIKKTIDSTKRIFLESCSSFSPNQLMLLKTSFSIYSIYNQKIIQ